MLKISHLRLSRLVSNLITVKGYPSVQEMQQISILAVVLCLQACATSQPQNSMSDSLNFSAQSPLPESLKVASTTDRSKVGFNLSDHQWQHRLVLIFAPSERSSAYQQQMQKWAAHPDGIRERDLKLVEVLGTGASRVDGQPITSSSAERLRQQFGVTTEDFAVILVGKDGTAKQRQQEPVEPTQFFQTIDAMPMRQQEMRSQQ